MQRSLRPCSTGTERTEATVSELLALWVAPALATVGTLTAALLAAGTVGVWDPTDDTGDDA